MPTPTMIHVIKTVFGYNLKSQLWGKSLKTMQVIIDNNKEEEFMRLLKDLCPDPVDIWEIHSLMCFDSDFIYKQLKIKSR